MLEYLAKLKIKYNIRLGDICNQELTELADVFQLTRQISMESVLNYMLLDVHQVYMLQ